MVSNLGLAALVGSVVGWFAGEATVEIAQDLGKRIIMRQNYAQLIRSAFDNLTPITDEIELKKMIDYMRSNPAEALALFQKARDKALSEALIDTVKGFVPQRSEYRHNQYRGR